MEYIFKDVLDVKNGKNQREVECPDGQYPIYGSGGVMGYASDYICEADTVIIGRKGNINNPIYAEEPFWNVDTAFGLCAKKDILLPKYLFYFCIKFDFERLNRTVTIPSLTKSDLLKIKIQVPSLDVQQEVIDKLTKIESILNFRKQELKLLDELVRGRFVELFDKWKYKYSPEPLGEYLENITYGFTNPMPDAEVGPWKITAKDIVGGTVNFDTARKTSQQSFDELTAKSKPQLGDVLLTKDGSLGRTAVVEVEGICVNQSVAVIKTNQRVDPYYLSILLEMPKYHRDMMADAGGGTIKHIYITKIVKMPILVPKKEEQEKFLDFVHQIDKSKFGHLSMLTTMKSAYDQQTFIYP